MRGLFYNGTDAQYREDLSVPVRNAGQSLIKIHIAAVCSTDKEIRKGYRPDFRGIMGHEFVGTVEDSDDLDLIGKRVVGEINEVCHECLYCKTNRPHHCLNRSTPGLSKDGCFAEYIVLNTENLHIVPDSLPDEVAVYTEPLAAAFEMLEQVSVEKNMPVGILGDGRLALCCAHVMHLAGADVTVIGKHDEKLELFREIAKTIKTTAATEETSATKTTTSKETTETTNEVGSDAFEIVVEATGSADGILEAMKYVRKMGTIILKSTYAEEKPLNLSMIPVNEITVVGSRCGPFEPALKALEDGSIKLPPIELCDLSQYKKAFSSKAFKAGFLF